jgi:hypothetical protein
LGRSPAEEDFFTNPGRVGVFEALRVDMEKGRLGNPQDCKKIARRGFLTLEKEGLFSFVTR